MDVTIEGIAYVVEGDKTPDQLEAEGHPNLAVSLRRHGWARYCILRRPKGRVLYMAHYHQRGFWSKVVNIGRQNMPV